jgi:hypothetical protein
VRLEACAPKLVFRPSAAIRFHTFTHGLHLPPLRGYDRRSLFHFIAEILVLMRTLDALCESFLAECLVVAESMRTR